MPKSQEVMKEKSTPVDNHENKPAPQVVALDDNTLELLSTRIGEIIDICIGRFAKRLNRALILHARLCAADTVRTAERADSVFRHAIKESEIAIAEIKKHFTTPTQGSSK